MQCLWRIRFIKQRNAFFMHLMTVNIFIMRKVYCLNANGSREINWMPALILSQSDAALGSTHDHILHSNSKEERETDRSSSKSS